jgi:gliding motility-associated-like protein
VWPTPVVDAGPDKIILENASITLDGSASNGNGLRFQWTPSNSLNDPSILKPLARPAQETRYLLTVTTDKGCSDTSSMLLKVLFKPAIPNTFTPNGDGYNDRWEILNLGAYPDPIVEIYNDRGLLLMRSTGTYRPWDGTYKGMPLPAGTYYYVIHPRSGRDRVAGYITILR